jgi:EAL domain-containing protein (putative c-di-GMP-specific phosphodiesterase class I)/CheY-like chemotaxis protein
VSEPAAASILVIDDEAPLREIIARALQRAGFQALTAENGGEGLTIVASQHVDLVVCDIALPDISGLELVSALRVRAGRPTLPVILITGSGGHDSVLRGLAAGADDFLQKPVRLEELVARVRTHLRAQDEWIRVAAAELEVRSRIVQALGALRAASDPEEMAETVVREIADRSSADFVSVLQVTPDGTLQELATFTPAEGVRRGARLLPPETARQLLQRASSGPWVEDLRRRVTGPGSPSFERADLSMYASAPIHAGSELVGLLSIGISARGGNPAPQLQARLLAGASDYSNVLSAVAGRAIADRRDLATERLRLGRILDAGAHHIVFQPIVSLATGEHAGYEALTRFADDERPDRRFAEAWAASLGPDFELAAVKRAVEASASLPADAFVSLNVSPRLITEHADRLARSLGRAGDRVILELTENVPIDDYAAIREQLAALNIRGIAVDDAGAGYAGLRHMLELRPAYAKLDMSLVRGIDTDAVRQAMAAGLQYFALRTGCQLIGEGVESEAEAAMLRRLGVELAQGFLFGRPAAVDAA